MAHLEVKRRMGPSDIAAIRGLLGRARAAYDHEPLGEDQLMALRRQLGEGFTAVIATGASGEPVGYAQASRSSAGWLVELVVDPLKRQSRPDISSELLKLTIDDVAAQGGGRLHLWIPKPDPADDRVAAGAALVHERDLYQMRRPLPAEAPPESVGVRAFRPGHDEVEWLRVNNRAFAGHPDQGDWDAAELVARETQPWFDPEGFLLHEREGRLAAFCWTKIHGEETPVLGEIYVIGVDPDFQGRGLGRALTLAGLDWMARKGVRTGMLYTGSTNVAALGLYERLGFSIDHVDRCYGGRVDPL